MGKVKGSKRQKKHGSGASRFPKTTALRDSGFRGDDDLDDDIDAFHKQRDMIPLDTNAEDASDDEMDEPVFDFQGGEDEDEDENDDNDTCADEGNVETVDRLPHLSAKIARQAKFLSQRNRGVDDDSNDEDDDESEEEKRTVWGKHKSMYFQGDNVDFELLSSDDDEELHEEEEEVLRMQREKANTFSIQDFGLEASDEDGKKKSLRLKDEMSANACTDGRSEINMLEDVMKVKKDLNALLKEEQMDVVYSTAPELVGLLSELKETIDHLNGVNCLLCKMKEKESVSESAMYYLEVKKRLLLAYLQSITFYLLLKSEGHSVRDHPVIARLVELKKLFEKIKQIDEKVLLTFEEVLKDDSQNLFNRRVVEENVVSKCQPGICGTSTEVTTVQELGKIPENIQKNQNNRLGVQNKKMLEARANLEEKFKQKGYNSSKGVFTKQPHVLLPTRKSLNTPADYDNEVADPLTKGRSSSKPTKLSQLVATKVNKPTKHVSGDDDVPIRDNIGERRRKYELKVLNATGDRFANDYDVADQYEDIESNDADQELNDESQGGEDEFYKQAKVEWASRLAAKGLQQQAKRLKRENKPGAPLVASAPETETEGTRRRPITHEMEMNRGLTRYRKKLTKIPRKKYKMKHQKAVVRRKGQVRDIRIPWGPYGGEPSGINVNVSHSIRFKN